MGLAASGIQSALSAKSVAIGKQNGLLNGRKLREFLGSSRNTWGERALTRWVRMDYKRVVV